MTPSEIIGLIQTAETLLPAATQLIDIVKKLSSEATLANVLQARAEVDQAISDEDAALENAKQKEMQ